MINTYYVIKDRKYLDRHLIRENFHLSKSSLQYLLRQHTINDKEVVKLQNKKLYSMEGIKALVEKLICENGKQ